jgi:soluble lytic murein transglycosylase
LKAAAQAIHDGDYDTAIQADQAVVDGSSSAAQKQTALIELALTYLRADNLTDAIDRFNQYIAQYPKADRLADAYFGQGEAYFDQAQWDKSVAAYQKYLDARGDVIAAYVQERIGDADTQSGDLAAAAAAYQAAIAQAADTSNIANLHEKLALTDRGLKRNDAALAQYDAILSFAQQPRYRAQILYQSGQTMIDAGQTDDGYKRFVELVNTYPETNDAYQALVTLVNAGVTVNEFQRGLVDYNAKQYDAAIAAFERFIAANADHGNAYYYIGLSYRGAGDIPAATKAFDLIINTQPEASRWGDAWLEKAQTQWIGGDLDGAVNTLATFVKKHPNAPQAPTALWNAAGFLERNGDYARAIDFNIQLQAGYPYDDNASEALFDAGLDAYRAADPARAISAWQTLSDTYPLSQLHTAAVFWQGKTLLNTDRAKAEVLLKQAGSDGLNYFGLRATDVLSNVSSLPFIASRLSIDPDDGRAAAETWLANWLSIDTAKLRSLPASITSSARFQRGQEYWRLGKTAQARDEFIALRSAFDDDALAQYTLAIYYRDIGLYYPSIAAASRLIRMSPAGSVEQAPIFLARLVYPIYYANLIGPEAEANQIDPLVIFALIRQESLFEGIATSSAYANGLMQIIPETGQWIATQLHWPNYQVSDLYRPLVSAKFGVYYLAWLRDGFDGDLFAAWAGYNGGPGNATHWRDAAKGDVDLFVENISLAETRLYIERLRENLAIYQKLYGK